MDESYESASPVELLNIALRGRVDTIPELADATGRSMESVLAEVSKLEKLGFLSVTNGTITYRRPDVAVADVSQQILQGLARDIDDALTRTQAALKTFPELFQSWEHGHADEHSLHIDVLHGPWAPADMWLLQSARGVPRVSDVCMPDTSALFTAKPEHQAAFWAGRAGEPLNIRLIMSIADATNLLGQDRVQGELDAGVQIRMHPNPPSFFWITDHDTIGIPLDWGQAWPNSVMAIRSPALAAVLTWVYDRIWQESVPVMGFDHPWEPLLILMSKGMSMEAASHLQGLTARTGRQRVSEAMAHYGVSSQFALGAAWSKNQKQ